MLFIDPLPTKKRLVKSSRPILAEHAGARHWALGSRRLNVRHPALSAKNQALGVGRQGLDVRH